MCYVRLMCRTLFLNLSCLKCNFKLSLCLVKLHLNMVCYTARGHQQLLLLGNQMSSTNHHCKCMPHPGPLGKGKGSITSNIKIKSHHVLHATSQNSNNEVFKLHVIIYFKNDNVGGNLNSTRHRNTDKIE